MKIKLAVFAFRITRFQEGKAGREMEERERGQKKEKKLKGKRAELTGR